MTIDADTLIKVLTFAVSVGGALYAWVMSQGKAAEPKLKEMSDKLVAAEAKLSAAEGRIAKLEGEMTHLPDKDMVHRLELGLKDMQAQINGQGEIVKAVERTMQRVETFLLEAQGRAPAAARRGK